MRMFGYLCSVYCRNKAEAEGLELPVYANQRSEIQRKSQKRSKTIMGSIAAVVLLLIAVGIYYKAYASKPRIIHSRPIAASEYEIGVCKLLDEETYLSIVGDTVSLHDVKSGDERWTASTSAPAGDDDNAFAYRGEPQLVDHQNNIWILIGNEVMCFERDSGTRQHHAAVDGYVEKSRTDDDSITLLSSAGGGFEAPERTVTKIAFADGAVTTYQLPKPEPATVAQTLNGSAGQAGELVKSFFHMAGPNLVELRVKLLEERTIVHEAIKKPKQSILDSGQVSGANSMQAAEELINEITRTTTGGKAYEDASRYQVTLRRHMADDAHEWSGEVVGKVALYPMETMDLLVAGKSLHVFDKQNKLKWQTQLTFPVNEFFAFGFGEATAPAIEANGMLYFFDQGMLTAFDPETGTPKWRVTSVGIMQVQADERGDLYLSTSTAGAEDIEFSQQIKVFDKVRSVLMKVDAETGEILWQTPRAGDNCFLTGNYVYSTAASMDITAALNPENSDVHFRVYRIHPKTGERMWTHYRSQEAMAMDFHENILLLRYPDEIQLLKYTSL